jgi:hypothetical protein
MADFCARLNKHEIVLPCLFFALLCRDFAFVREISFVADEDYDDIVSAFGADIIDPSTGLIEGLGI